VWIDPKEHKVIGQCLAALRRRAQLSQVELAQRLKKPQSFVSAFETGQRRLDLLEFATIVSTLEGDPVAVSRTIFSARGDNAVKGRKGRR